MSVRVNIDNLAYEIARRGWTRGKLARTAGLSPSTVNAAFNGRPIHARSLYKIGSALESQSPSEPVGSLIDRT